MENFSEHFGEHKNSYRAAYLVSGFIQKTLTEEEAEELDEWINASEDNMQLFEDLTDEKMVNDFLAWYAETDTETRLSAIKSRLSFNRKSKVRKMIGYAAAAALVGIVGFGIYLFNQGSTPTPSTTAVSQDIKPGGEFAILKLGNENTIVLNKDTILSPSVKIINGSVVYEESAQEVVQHSLSTARKGFYRLLLPDGTRVWLNAESSISYPSRFAGEQRRVEVTGETYFEVAKDASKPFIVSVNGVDVQALGTAFNINAYPNETASSVTLVEGAIKVSNVSNEAMLQPSQQIRIASNEWKLLKNIDTSPYTAWKNSEFKFRNAPIHEIMRQVERWYDAKIDYENLPDIQFNGTVSRNEPVSKLLRLMEKTGEVSFEIHDDTIIVKAR